MKLFSKNIAALALLYFLAAFALPLHAQQPSGQCTIDHSLRTNTDSFVQCPVSDSNDAILEAGFNGVRLDSSDEISKSPIFVHNICKYVDNNSGSSLFIPLKTSEEWAAFLTRPVSGVHLAGCCLPRPMVVGDVPTPQTSCESGWVFKGLVDSADHTHLIAEPVSKSAESGFVLANNQSEDGFYPVLKLPMNRDDISAVLPDNSRPSKSYTAQYACSGQDDAFLNFHMQCAGTKWVTTSASDDEAVTAQAKTQEVSMDVTATTTQETTSAKTTADIKPAATCQTSKLREYTKPCPNGASGSITYRDVFNSCTKQIEAQVVSQTCGGITGGTTGCTASTRTQTVTCPTNPAGTITTVTTHICDGSNNGAGRDSVNTTRQNCPIGGGTTGCTPSTNTQTQTCPTNPAGTITTVTNHICDGTNNGAGRDQIIVTRRNCATGGTTGCVASSNTSTQTCPTNPLGTISTITAHICDGSNGGLGRDTITQTRQNCPIGGGTTGCTATTNTQTVTCPTNPLGTITTIRRHICDGSNNGAGRDTIDTTRQNCPIGGGTTGCTPSTNTNTTPCPSGQTGSITTVTSRVCDGSNNGAGSTTSTVTSNTCVAAPPGGGTTYTCKPSDVLTTKPCPQPNNGGIITVRRVRVCDGSNNGAGTSTETLYQNNCVPAGCIKSTILKTSTVCPGGTLVTAKVYDSCTKQVSIETISNTCN
ncbi:MAG: hypothetical protein SFW65_08425 [Alphaproteobacteria bacterium]|nr:hypothetical protein [Alphaproteobacteria bacterium]